MRQERLFKHVDSSGLQGLHKCSSGILGEESEAISKTEYNLIRAAISLKADPENGLLPMEHICEYADQLRDNVTVEVPKDESSGNS